MDRESVGRWHERRKGRRRWQPQKLQWSHFSRPAHSSHQSSRARAGGWRGHLQIFVHALVTSQIRGRVPAAVLPARALRGTIRQREAVAAALAKEEARHSGKETLLALRPVVESRLLDRHGSVDVLIDYIDVSTCVAGPATRPPVQARDAAREGRANV